MINTIAIDDEPMALEVIQSFSSQTPLLNLLHTFTNATEALTYTEKHPVDLVFLDIKMPDINGIEWARSLSRPVMIVFTTAYSEHALESFELEAIDYLLKPFTLERFRKAAAKAYQLHQLKLKSGMDGYVFVKDGNEQVKVILEDIQYVQSAGNYVQFVTVHAKILSRLTMQEAESMLPAGSFVRIHRSFIVPVNKIVKINKDSVWLGEISLPVGGGYGKRFGKLL